jgi:hypothetical protein
MGSSDCFGARLAARYHADLQISRILASCVRAAPNTPADPVDSLVIHADGHRSPPESGQFDICVNSQGLLCFTVLQPARSPTS